MTEKCHFSRIINNIVKDFIIDKPIQHEYLQAAICDKHKTICSID